MGKKRIVIALGGNALGKNLPEQYLAVQETSRAIADLIEAGNEVIISHGNGPQVGMINNAMAAYSKTEPSHPAITPLSVCVAMSQAYIGYDLQNALKEELLNRGIKKNVATVITQVRVDENDPAFEHPTKPIGQFMTKEEADAAVASSGIQVMEDAGRGYRRVVASPNPVDIVEVDAIRTLTDAGHIVIACGGGGIPVLQQNNHLKGASGVIEKDLTAGKLAEQIDADELIILTSVEKVCLNHGKEDEEELDTISVEQAKQYMDEGHFGIYNMLPKFQASVGFIEKKEGRSALITSFDTLKDALKGKTGTVIE